MPLSAPFCSLVPFNDVFFLPGSSILAPVLLFGLDAYPSLASLRLSPAGTPGGAAPLPRPSRGPPGSSAQPPGLDVAREGASGGPAGSVLCCISCKLRTLDLRSSWRFGHGAGGWSSAASCSRCSGCFLPSWFSQHGLLAHSPVCDLGYAATPAVSQPRAVGVQLFPEPVPAASLPLRAQIRVRLRTELRRE